MSNGLWIFIIFILCLFFMILMLRQGHRFYRDTSHKDSVLKENETLKRELSKLRVAYDNCQDVKFADENIFNYVRCINVPRTPVCKPVSSGGDVCRSRLIDCDKFKLYVLDDPIAMFRMKMMTDNIEQSTKSLPLTEEV
jgi:hypothetical protein